MKPWIHICKNCEYFGDGVCVNCDSPSDIRYKKPDDVCDGGGAGSDCFGFRPKGMHGDWILIRTK